MQRFPEITEYLCSSWAPFPHHSATPLFLSSSLFSLHFPSLFFSLPSSCPPLSYPSSASLSPSLPTPKHPRRGCALNPFLQLHPLECRICSGASQGGDLWSFPYRRQSRAHSQSACLSSQSCNLVVVPRTSCGGSIHTTEISRCPNSGLLFFLSFLRAPP